MENPQLNSLLSQLENDVNEYISKKANITEKDVLGGDRLDTLPAGEPQKVEEEELDNSSFESGNPVQEGYDENFGKEYNLEEKRMEEALEAEKSAKLANDIVAYYYNKKASPKTPKTNSPKTPKTAPSKTASLTKEEMEKYKVIEAAMKEALQEGGGDILHAIASTVDPKYTKIACTKSGSDLANATLSYMRGLDIGSSHKAGYEKAASILAGAKDADVVLSAIAGFNKAAYIIQKIAADLVAVRPIIQELEYKNLITQAEREALTSALASSDELTPEVITQATSGMSNADIIAGALLKAITGKIADNVPLEPVTQATVTEAAPTTLDPNNPEDKVIEAAAMIIKNRKKGCKK